MSIKKTYIPAKPRSSKLVGTSTGGRMTGGISSSAMEAIDANSHTHPNKSVIDQLTQADINVLEKFSLVDGNLRIDANTYSTGNLSAFGLGEEQGGGVIINVIDNLTSTSKTDALSANQGRYLKTLIDNIEVGEGGQVIVDWEAITGKPDTFVPSAHDHIIGDVTGLQGALDGKASLSQLDDKEDKFTKNSAFNKNFGTGSNDVARGNHTHAFESLTSIPTTLSGYGITDAYTKTNVNDLLSNKADKATKITAGDGLTGGGQLDDDRTITLGTPGTLSNSTTNSVTATSHTHSIDPSDFNVSSLRTTIYNTTTPATAGSINYGRLSSENAGNLPVWNNANAILTMAKHSGNYDSQLAFSSNDNIYYRSFSNEALNTTKAWNKLAFTTDNVASATKLQNSRTLWGQSFNGEANVSGAMTGITTLAMTGALTAPDVLVGGVTTSDKSLKNFINTFNSMFELEGDVIRAKKSLYSDGEISAFGLGEEGGGSGGGSMSMMQGWTFTTATENYYLPAKLAVPFYDDTRSRLSTLEGGSATTVNVSGAGDLLASVSKVGNNINFIKGNQSWNNLSGKPSTFVPSAHSHPISDITNLQTTLADKLETSIFDTHNNDNVRHITGAERTKWNTVVTKADNYVGFYHAPNGFLVKTDVARTEISMFVLHIKGNSYGGIVPINTLVQGQNDTLSDSVVNVGALNNGYEINEVKVFYYNNLVYFWIPQQVGYQTMTFQLLKRNEQANRVVSVSNSAIPVDGVEKLVTTIPQTAWFKNTLTQLSQLTDNIGVATHIANTSNPHSVTKSQVGLGNVDNTSDLLKPISTATQNALNLKANLASPTFTGVVTAPKVNFGNGWTAEGVGAELQFKLNGVIQAKIVNGALVSTGEVTAFY